MATRSSGGRPRVTRGLRLKPADSFELIRWLARSQSDPRKAVAELVQNSLDAGARQVRIRRVRIKRALAIVVRDDGEGVLPELDREAALGYIATHVGRSRKLGLDPGERARRVVAGKYGVGLLGFWCIGRTMELRSRVAGSPLYALRLLEDSPNAEILKLPHRLDAPDTYTEVAVLDVHPAAQKPLGGRRLCDYLAAELRGQILRSGVEISIHDGVARGIARKDFVVTPVRFTGERLELPAELEAPGFAPLRVELYQARGAERPAIQVAAAGTLVADDMAELGALGIVEAPWVGRELVGLLDFASFNVPPGTRRGVIPDAAAEAFASALAVLRPLVEAELARLESERRVAADRDVLRELRRALRGLRRRLPHYELPRVENAESPGGAARGAPLDVAADAAAEAEEPETAPLFPPGPLASLRIVPAEIRVAPGAERRVQAVGTDAEGRRVRVEEHRWSLEDLAGAGLSLVGGEGARPAIAVPARAATGSEGRLRLEGRAGERTLTAEAPIRVEESDRDESSGLGIPEPHLLSDADGTWRSRLDGERWEVNDAHADYVALVGEPRARLRYLLGLLAKEIVLKTSGRPGLGDVLESMVEVLAHAERNLRGA